MIRHIFLFAAAGVVGLLVDIVVLYAVQDSFGPFFGRALSFLAAVVATWLVNRSITFRERPSGLSLVREFSAYLSLMLVGGAVNYAAYSALVLASDLVRERLFTGVAAGSVAGMVVNFLTARFVLYRRQER